MTDETETPTTFSDLPEPIQRRIFLPRLAQQRQEIDQITLAIQRMNLAVAREQEKVDIAVQRGNSQSLINHFRGNVLREQDRLNVGITRMAGIMNDQYQLRRTMWKAGR